MTVTTSVEALGDAELISAVRGGDVDAYGALFERHVGAARRLARQLVAAGDVEDLVSESFVKVLTVLQRGGGPDVAFRAYLLTAVRRLRVDRLRAGARLQPTDDLTPFDPGVPFRDTAVEGFESAAAARAFASLPERWQLVLWHTEVEGQRPAEVAQLLGMSANSVSALAYRAREGLRQAFLNEHVTDLEDDLCRWTHAHLGGYVRDGLSRRDAGKVESHLDECRTCMGIYLELSEVNSNLAGLLAPLLLGGAATAYLASTTAGAAAPTGLLALLDRARDVVVAHAQASAVAGVATAVVVTGVTTFALSGPDELRPVADPPATALPAAPEASRGEVSTEPRTGRRSRRTDAAVPPASESTADSAADSPGSTTASPGETGVGAPAPPAQETETQTPTGQTPTGQTPTGQTPTGQGPADQGPGGQGPAAPGPGPQPPTGPDQEPPAAPGPAPAPAPAPAPEPAPAPQPPAPVPAPEPQPPLPEPPPGEPAPEPPPGDPAPLPTADLSVSASVTREPPEWRVTVSVQGLPAGAGAFLEVSGAATVLTGSNLDSRCEVTAPGADTIRCTITAGSGSDGAFVFRSRSVEGAVLTFTVGSTELTDPDPTNDTVIVPVG